MKFSYDWFGHNGKNWIKWLEFFKGRKNLNFLEIGCFEGRATVWLLDHILTDPSSIITVIDTFEGSIEHKIRNQDFPLMLKNFAENIKPYAEKVLIKQGYSQIVLREFKPSSFHFIYIDGSHQAPDVLEDTLLSWRLLKKDGILIFDDYSWGEEFDDPLLRPKMAIDAFLEIFKNEYKMIAKERQVCIKKIK